MAAETPPRGAAVPPGGQTHPVAPADHAPPSGSGGPSYPEARPYPQGQPYPQGPYPQGQPYPQAQPYPQTWPYPQARANRSWDGFAVAGFVISILGGILLSVIFCLVALSRIRRSGARGRGLAISGLVLSGVWVALFALLASAGLLTVPNENTTGPVGSQNLQPGVCLAEVPTGTHMTVDAVACASPHKALVVAAFDLSGFAYPGDDEVVAAANDGCLERLPVELQSRDDLEIHYLHPQRQGWALGDHEVVCLVAAVSGTLTEDLATLVPDVEA